MNFFPIKSQILAVVATVMLLGPTAMAADIASCELNESTYTFDSDGQYQLETRKVISKQSSPNNGTAVTLSDAIYPIYYSVSFTPAGKIEGRLWMRINQPGPSHYGAVNADDTLHLWLEEASNTSATVYTLDCQLGLE
ncbi:MAG: hypothetical protein JNJ49_02735 [Bdellovibrionaceae bacterium]|nr:hypothetical protein [Pseudobdellovibrionaceae bacterium]